MFAWILKTKPENVAVVGLDDPVRALPRPRRRRELDEPSRNGSTPKLVIALPKKTGVSCPARNLSVSNGVAGVVEQLDLVAANSR